MNQTANTRRKILLIRHAQSAFNSAAAEAEQYKDHIDFKERVKEINFSLDLLDCKITDFGKEQAKKAAEKVKDRNIALIFTSPLRRCMQTAQEIFKEHKNKIRVVVVPALREQLGATCDIADDLDKLQAEFPEHDFSLCNAFEHRKLWYIYSLKNEELRKTLFEEILSQASDQEKTHLKAAEVIISKMREVFPDILERGKHIYDRVTEVKEWLFTEASKVNEGEEVAIVAHSVSLQCFTAMDIDQNGNLIGEKYLDNCEVYEFEYNI